MPEWPKVIYVCAECNRTVGSLGCPNPGHEYEPIQVVPASVLRELVEAERLPENPAETLAGLIRLDAALSAAREHLS